MNKRKSMVSNGICVAFLIYFPGREFLTRLEALFNLGLRIYVVNNGAGEYALSTLKVLAGNGRIQLLNNGRNVGVAAGLNQAMRQALHDGMEWMFTFDQDSLPSREIIEIQVQLCRNLTGKEEIGIIAPVIVDLGTGKPMRYLQKGPGLLFRRAKCERDEVLRDVLIALSSGSLTNLAVAEKAGYFREDFFIDYVDTEYCLRIRSLGYETVVACRAFLSHRLGKRERRSFGSIRFFPTFHSPTRWYYISRNRVPMLRMYGLKFPPWLSFEVLSSAYILIRMLLFEDHRWKKLKAIFFGTRDGLRGRMGPIPPAVARVLGEL